MKRYIILSLAVMSLMSCDDRLDFISEMNKAPIVSLDADPSMQVFEKNDSLKTAIKSGSPYYNLDLYTFDAEDVITEVHYEVVLGSAKVYRNDVAITNNTIAMSGRNTSIQIEPESDQTRIIFTVTDAFGAKGNAVLYINSFLNKPPVAKLKTEKIGVLSAKEYEFDASGSYDRDRNYGGSIAIYHYTFDGRTIVSDQPKIRWVFNTTGGKEIVVRVQDNDREWSNPVSQIIQVN